MAKRMIRKRMRGFFQVMCSLSGCICKKGEDQYLKAIIKKKDDHTEKDHVGIDHTKGRSCRERSCKEKSCKGR